MGVEQREVRPLPVPDWFPVEWEDEHEERLFFRQAKDHFPRPISPLDFDYFKTVLEYGVGAVSDAYEGPIVGWHLRRFNAWFYQSMVPFTGEPEEVENRAARSEAKILADMRRVGERWSGEILPEVEEHLAWWDGFDLEGASLEALVDHIDESWERGKRLWELHFSAIVPAYIALSEFEELYRQLFGEGSSLDAFKLIAGYETKNTEISTELWRLSRRALASEDVLEALRADDPAAILAALDQTEAGRAFAAELDGFLAVYGHRGDTWVLSAPTWIEAPALVLKNIRELTTLSDEEAPDATLRRAAADRDRLLGEARSRLEGYPAPVRQSFEELLGAAQAATVIQDDHNFYIDFCSSARVRRVLLEAGRRLAESGAIARAGDVFMLTREEIRRAGLTPKKIDSKALAEERREELERASGIEPPANLGTRPRVQPLENPVFRFMSKFYGIPPEPSGRSDVVQGLPGSAGKARGIARVILSIDEVDRLQPGEILVTETTAPPWTPLFATAAAVVTDSGGILSHAAVVAREYGIPAVVGSAVATTTIEDGEKVEVDGTTGTVRRLDAGDEGATLGDEAPAVRSPASENGHRSFSVDDPARYVRERQLRNEEIISEGEQGIVNSLTVLVGGCGSVGGSIVEPLVRLGVGELILADPDDYELNNVNRQACTVDDLGRPKVEVLAERARSINPLVRVTTLGDGLTPDNVEQAVRSANIVFDGVDPSPGPLWMKYLLHRHAARNRVPVLAGADLGGQPTLYVFDYRRDSRPFYGKANVAAFREGRLFEALIPWMGLRNVPSDFLPIVLGRASAPPSADGDRRLMEQLGWPQISYCAAALGALGTRTIVSVAGGREVPHVITADLHMLTRPRSERAARKLRRPLELAQTVRTLRKLGALAEIRGVLAPAPRPAQPAIPSSLLPVLESARQAPSAHNTQPWRITVEDERRLRLGYDRTRQLQVSDPDGRYLCHSIGCAIEAMNAVARIEFTPGGGPDPLAPGWEAGEVLVEGIREDDYQAGAGAVAARGTNRWPYDTAPIPRATLRRFEEAGERFGVQVYAITDNVAIRNFAKIAGMSGAGRFLSGPLFDEFLEWVRFSEKERDWDADGFTAESLALGPAGERLLRQLKRSTGLRRASMRASLPALMARQSGRTVRQSAALLYLTTRTSSAQAWIDGGRAMMSVWLEATKANLAMQPVTFPLDVGEARPVVTQLFRASLTDQPVVVMRVGRPVNHVPPTPRLSVSRFCTVANASREETR